jgi:ubiquinone/menaquinone biosynthesis C-methylase UbiE
MIHLESSTESEPRHYPPRLNAGRLAQFFDRFGGLLRVVNDIDHNVINAVVDQPCFRTANLVVEIGVGNGAVAARILAANDRCLYVATDVSGRLLNSARKSVRPHEGRFLPVKVGPTARQPIGSATAAVVLSMFVIDCMSPHGIRVLLEEAYRILRPGGTLCLVHMRPGRKSLADCAWRMLYRLSPWLVGGSRPIQLAPFLEGPEWTRINHISVTSMGLTSGVVAALRRE